MGRLFAGFFLSVPGLIVIYTLPLAAAETVLIHGRVYTGSKTAKWAEAVAITSGKIDAIGSDEEIIRRQDARTKVIDLQGRTVIPGVSDAHTHMWFGGLALRGFNLATQDVLITPDQPDELVARIREFASNHPGDKVLFGRTQFSSNPGSNATRQLLDRAVSDRPVIVHNTTEHSLWVNSKALAMAGINEKPVSDPVEERYVMRDSQGRPTGVLLDPAMQLIVRALPEEPLDDRMAILRNAARYLNTFGITSVTNATGNLKEIETYAALRDRGELTIRTRTSFAEVSVNQHLTQHFLADLDKARSRYHDDWVSANLVKFFADGGADDIAIRERLQRPSHTRLV